MGALWLKSVHIEHMVELALQSGIEVAKLMSVLVLLAGLTCPQRNPFISGTLAKKIPTSYEGKLREWKLGKRNDLNYKRLVAGPNPSGHTNYEESREGFFFFTCDIILTCNLKLTVKILKYCI